MAVLPSWSGWISALLLPSSTDRARGGAVRAFDCIVFRGNLNAGVGEDRGNRWVLLVFGVIGFLNMYLPAYTDRKELWTIDGDTIRLFGVALFAVGGALRIWPVFVLGQRESVCFSQCCSFRGSLHGFVQKKTYSVPSLEMTTTPTASIHGT